MFRSKGWSLLAWHFDEVNGHDESVLRLRFPGKGTNMVLAEALYPEKKSIVLTKSTEIPREDAAFFCRWLWNSISTGGDCDPTLFKGDGGSNQVHSCTGELTFPGERYWFCIVSYPEGDNRDNVFEVSFSKNGRPSQFVRNRTEALKVIKKYKVRARLDDKALMDVASALKKAEMAEPQWNE